MAGIPLETRKSKACLSPGLIRHQYWTIGGVAYEGARFRPLVSQSELADLLHRYFDFDPF